MPIRLLLADDHAVFRSGLSALLAKEPDMAVVAEAGDGPGTLEAASRVEVDVVVLDLNMPGLAGTATAAALLGRAPDLAIVVLTMHEDEVYLRECLQIGVRGFVLKKSTSTDVIQAIRAAHRGERYIDPALASALVSAYVGRPEKKAGRLDALTLREQDVCRLVAYGHTNAEIAEFLRVSKRTVETHRSSLMEKLGLKTRAEVVRFAMEEGLLKGWTPETGTNRPSEA